MFGFFKGKKKEAANGGTFTSITSPNPELQTASGASNYLSKISNLSHSLDLNKFESLKLSIRSETCPVCWMVREPTNLTTTCSC